MRKHGPQSPDKFSAAIGPSLLAFVGTNPTGELITSTVTRHSGGSATKVITAGCCRHWNGLE